MAVKFICNGCGKEIKELKPKVKKEHLCRACKTGKPKVEKKECEHDFKPSGRPYRKYYLNSDSSGGYSLETFCIYRCKCGVEKEVII